MSETTLLVEGRLLGPQGRGRVLRERAGLSLRDVAVLADVHISALSRWERGEGKPSREAAIRWARVCAEIAAALSPEAPGDAP
jgi:transcriptional regulator with XRE-family HTH domain